MGICCLMFLLKFVCVKQRERKRRNSDRSEDGYHSDGDYADHDYRRDPGNDKKSKTIMLGGLSPQTSEEDVSFFFSFFMFFFFLFTHTFNYMKCIMKCIQLLNCNVLLSVCCLDSFRHRSTRGTPASRCQADEKENRWEPSVRWTWNSLPKSLTIGQICFHSDPFSLSR